MRYLSLFSGIEAASVAWHDLGWTPVAFAEIEKFPSAVLKHRFPNVPNWGDVTKYQEWPDADIDVLVGGSPCQSFSVAGLRKGLADPRGNLMLTYLAIAQRYRPRWVVWENVPGVLSSNQGMDFGTFLGGLGECGYGFAYRVLDAQFVRTRQHPGAVPQRRRRVFVVGHLGDWRRAAAVFLNAQSLSGNPPPSRKAGQRFAGGAASGSGRSGWPSEVSCTLNTQYGDKMGLENQHALNGAEMFVPATFSSPAIGDIREDDVAGTITRHSGAGGETQNAAFVMASGQSGACIESDVSVTLTCLHEAPIAFQSVDHGADAATDLSPTLRRHDPMAVMQAIPIHDQATRHAGKRGEHSDGKGNGLGVGQPGDPAPTLTKGDKHAVAQPMAFKIRSGIEREDGSRGSTNIGKQAGKGFLGSEERAFTVGTTQDQHVAVPVGFRKTSRAKEVDGHETWVEGEVSSTLNTLDVGDMRAVDLVAQPVAHSLRGEGFDASEDGTGRGIPLVPDIAPTLDQRAGRSGENSFATSGGLVPVGTDLYNGAMTGDIAATMGTNGSSINGSGPTVLQPLTLAIRGRGDGRDLEWRQDGSANALLTPNGGRDGLSVATVAQPMVTAMRVRRLMPVECERLQGFPDGWTDVPWRGKPNSPDGPRYKALGNSMAVNCMRWIGERIQQVEDIHGD